MANRNNSGVLYKTKKKKSAKSPDYWGYATVDGKEFKVAGWIKDGDKGKFISLAYTEQDGEDNSAPF